MCKDTNSFGRCTIPYVYKLLIHLLGAIGINLRPGFVTSEEYSEKVFRREVADAEDVSDIQDLLLEADAALQDEIDEEEEENTESTLSDIFD